MGTIHIKEISKKIPCGISAIKRIESFVTCEILLTVYIVTWAEPKL